MYVVAGVLAVLLIVLVLEFFLLRNKLNRLYRKYMYFMKSAEGGSIEVKLSTEVRELREMIASSENMLHQQELLANMQLQSFQKTGLVRYDAFDDTGDKLSFSLTILDPGRTTASSFPLWQATMHPVSTLRKSRTASAAKHFPPKKQKASTSL